MQLRRGRAVPDAKLQEAEGEFRAQFATPDLYQEFVHTEFHDSEEMVRQRVRRSLLIEELLQVDVEQKSTVSDAALKAYYDKNPARFEHAESFSFQTISILPPKTPDPDQLKEGRRRPE